MPDTLPATLVICFSLFIACAFAFFISAAYLLLFKMKKANRLFKHPYLEGRDYAKYPLNIRMEILLDYFVRLMFPTSVVWLAANSNRLLHHVNPKSIPMDVKWPIVGLWGSCLIGTPVMVTLWILLMSSGTK